MITELKMHYHYALDTHIVEGNCLTNESICKHSIYGYGVKVNHTDYKRYFSAMSS